MSRGHRLPSNSMRAKQFLEESIKKLMNCSSIDNNNDYEKVLNYCKEDGRMITSVFDYVMKNFDGIKTMPIFQLIIEIYENNKKKETTDLMSRYLLKLFLKAFSLTAVRKWAVEEIERMDEEEKSKEMKREIRNVMRSNKYKDTKVLIEESNKMKEDDAIGMYQKYRKEIEGDEERLAGFKKQFDEYLGMILPHYCDEITTTKVECNDEALELQVFEDSYSIFKHYIQDSKEAESISLTLRDFYNKVYMFMNDVKKVYYSLIEVQELIDITTDEYLNEYKRTTHIIDELTCILLKLKELHADRNSK